MTDQLTVAINGTIYSGWTKIRVTRGIERCTSDFDIEVTERWAGLGATPWQIQLFDACTVAIDSTPILTGYVEGYDPAYSKSEHRVRITGRSKTCDLVDCMPDIGGGQYNGATLDAIARAVAQPFGIGVVVEANVGAAIPDATLEKTETAFNFLDRLARLRSVLLTDDAQGDLVLAAAGAGGTATGALVEGKNIERASAKLDCRQRFQTYVVLAQTPLAYDGQDTHEQILGQAIDGYCPRYRRHAEMAEAPADTALAQQRAVWRAAYNAARGVKAVIVVTGWRQPDGSLWQPNQLVSVQSQMLALDRTLLVSEVSYRLDDKSGRQTELTVAPEEAFIPDPTAAQLTRAGASGAAWSSIVKVTP